MALGERLSATVAAGSTTFTGAAIRVPVSIGLAVAPAGVAATKDDLFAAAAAALQDAKAAGKGRCAVRTLADVPDPPAVAVVG
jgi:GGDEF domain-containing protein